MPKAFIHTPQIDETIVFENGLIGCVTKSMKLVLVNKAGWMLSAKRALDAVEYCKTHKVLSVENNFEQFDDMKVAA